MSRFLSWTAAGAVLGYAGVRASEALSDLRSPAVPIQRDAPRYGRTQRALMLSGMARSLATLATAAYAVGPLLDDDPSRPDARAHRVASAGVAMLATSLLELPSDYVEGFSLERRFGLSKQSGGAWIADQAKGIGVSLAIGLPLLELLASAASRAPRSWPALATAGSLPLLVIANVVAPTFIAPLFNAFVPIEGAFADRVRALAARYGAGDATILRVDMSRQTEKANAYVTGLLGTKRIVIGDTLLDRFTPEETLFVVAHELGHYVARDVWRSVALGTVAAGFVFFGGRALAERSGGSVATTAGLARLCFAMSLLGTLAGPALATFSRSRERAADRFAVSATNDAPSGAAAFERLRETNMAEDEQPRWMQLLFASHPSLGSRIAFLRAASVDSSSSVPTH